MVSRSLAGTCAVPFETSQRAWQARRLKTGYQTRGDGRADAHPVCRITGKVRHSDSARMHNLRQRAEQSAADELSMSPQRQLVAQHAPGSATPPWRPDRTAAEEPVQTSSWVPGSTLSQRDVAFHQRTAGNRVISRFVAGQAVGVPVGA